MLNILCLKSTINNFITRAFLTKQINKQNIVIILTTPYHNLDKKKQTPKQRWPPSVERPQPGAQREVRFWAREITEVKALAFQAYGWGWSQALMVPWAKSRPWALQCVSPIANYSDFSFCSVIWIQSVLWVDLNSTGHPWESRRGCWLVWAILWLS